MKSGRTDGKIKAKAENLRGFRFLSPASPAPRRHGAAMDEITYIPLPPDAPPFTLPMLDLSGVRRKFLDVNYAGTDNPAQTMDILLPGEGDGPFPVLIQFHGGAFLGGDKRDAQNIYLAKGIQRGYAVVNVNYRLTGEAIFPLPVFDAKAAIRFLRANAGRSEEHTSELQSR